MSNSSRASLKKSLKQLDKERLIEIILGVCDFNQDAKCYIENFFTPQFEKASEKYKKIMDKEFDPWGGGNLNFAVCRKAISDYAKLNPPVEMLADLKLYLAANESHFTQYGEEYGDFYDNILEDYESALEFIAANNLERHFEEGIIKVYQEAKGGYYFPESMKSLAESICWKLFEDDEEELEIVEDADEEEVDVSVEEEETEKDKEIAQNNARDKDERMATEVSLAMEVGVETENEASIDINPDVEIEEIQDQTDAADPSEIEVQVDEVDDEDKLEISLEVGLEQSDQIVTEDVPEIEVGVDNDGNEEKLEVSIEIEIPCDDVDSGVVDNMGNVQAEVILIDDYDDSDMDFGEVVTSTN